MDRRRFFQSLGSSSSSRLTVQTSCQSPAHNRQLSSGEEETETGKGGNRKEFFKVLRGEKHTCHAEKQVSEEDQKQDDGIRFTLRSLLDFNHSMVEHAELEQSDPRNKKDDRRCRKRPNYNNSKRAFFAKGRPATHHEQCANGMSEARVRRLQSLEKCRCERKTCFSKIHSILSDLLRFLQMFWSLAKRAQDLFVMQTVGASVHVRRRWFLLGKRMSPKCVVAVIGFGNARLARLMAGHRDRRFRMWGGGNNRCPKKRKAVNHFLLDQYIKAAGMLPQKFQRAANPRSKAKQRLSEQMVAHLDQSGMDDESEQGVASDMEVLEDDLHVDGERLEENEELKLHVLGLQTFWTQYIETNNAGSFSSLPTRYLAPGSVKMLWHQLVQEKGHANISYATFWKTYRAKWSNVLRFQTATTHGVCDTCQEYKEQFRCASGDKQLQFDLARGYKDHIDAVKLDRELEQWMQEQCPLQSKGAPLCIHVDGMDQSKWGVPRNRGTRAAKSMAPLSKPKCKVQGVWAHGTMLKLYVLDPRMPSDSSTVLETVSRAVQEASEIFSQKGQDLPKELLLYADNCVRENKNSNVIRFLSYLVSSQKMGLTSISFGRVGHTHGCLDQIYGLLAICFRYIDVLAAAEDIAEKLRRVLQRIHIQKWLGPDARVEVEYISAAMDFKTWLERAPVTYSGGLRDDDTGHHSFTIMARKDVPHNIHIIETGRGELHPLDAILLLKRFASDCSLSQEPLVSFRHAYVAMVGPLPREARPLIAPNRKKRLVYLELAQLLLKKFPSESTARSIRFLLKLCRNEPPEPLVQLDWLESAPRNDVQINIDLPSLSRLAPVMSFNARHR